VTHRPLSTGSVHDPTLELTLCICCDRFINEQYPVAASDVSVYSYQVCIVDSTDPLQWHATIGSATVSHLDTLALNAREYISSKGGKCGRGPSCA